MVFSPAGQLALFPAPGQRVPDAAPWLCASSAEKEAAEAGRVARPLTIRALRAALDVVPPLGTLLAVAEVLRGVNGRLAVRLAYDAFQLTLFAFLWVYGLSLFGTRNLAAAQAAHIIRTAGWTLPMFTTGMRMWAVRDGDEAGHGEEKTIDAHPFAGLARYVQLARLDRGRDGTKDDPESSAGDAGALLDHDPGDDLCPCPVCTRGLLLRSRTSVLGLLAIGFPLVTFAYFISVIWTPAVTLAPSVWDSAWSTALCAVCVVVIFVLLEAQVPGTGGILNISALDIELRLRHRVVNLALADLHSRMVSTASVDPEYEPVLPRIDQEPYVSLHGQLQAAWRTGASELSAANRVELSALGTEALAAIICAAAGSCIPATYVAGAAFCLWMLGLAAVGVAARNQQPERAAAQYRTAAQELLVLSASLPAGREQLRGLLAAHVGMLNLFAGQEEARARFFGAHVTFGSLRGLLVGGFTVLAGLWTLLRAAGVGLTMDLACRAPT
ncbi:hypothetical protein DFJ74DRAFT_645667 [Hyaloraphidium curvatum]|nr:hypothetical protein DFJ74DRAFT_645667 [Hyaloraphidium curvatum]